MTLWDQFNQRRAASTPRKRLGRQYLARPITYRVEGECWICTSHKPGKQGYPRITLDGKVVTLPWLARKLRGGRGANAPVTRHTCDVRMCINPAHLIGGTKTQNSKDAQLRSRMPHGENQPNAKLTEQAVLAIRKSHDTGKSLAKQHSVAQSTISLIRNGKSWKYLNALDGKASAAHGQAGAGVGG